MRNPVKLQNVTQRGHIHLILPIITVLAVGAIGTYVLTMTNAQTASCNTYHYSQGNPVVSNNTTKRTGSAVICTGYIQKILNGLYQASAASDSGVYSGFAAYANTTYKAGSQYITTLGTYDTSTTNRVKALQHYYAITAGYTSGTVGAQTWTLLCGIGLHMPDPTSSHYWEQEALGAAKHSGCTNEAVPIKASASGGGSGSSGGSGGGGTVSSCTKPSWSGSNAEDTDPLGNGLWWINNDAWSGSHGPQTLYVCSQSSWYAVSNQTNNGGQVETYPDSEYDVGGRDTPSKKTISQWNAITSTFSEKYPSAGSWDAGYDLWTNNWTNETMIWNQWAGSQAYWYQQAKTTLTLNGVAYKFIDNGGELIFMRQSQVQSGSVDILAAWKWEVAHGYAKATDVPTQLEYGVEICATNGTETFPTTGLSFALN